MPTTMTYTGELVVQICWCGMRHAVPDELVDFQRRQHDNGAADVQAIYCPLGHSHVPAGTPKWKLEQRKREAAEAREQHLRDQLEASERSKAALKGEMTKAKKRAAAAVCPCCNRSFVQLRRHMASKHPDYEPS